MRKIPVDRYVLDVLMRDLIGHDRTPSAFIVYLHLWRQSVGAGAKTTQVSHQRVADATGLSKSAVQRAIRCLLRRQLVQIKRGSATATPEYQVRRPWVRGKTGEHRGGGEERHSGAS